MDNIEFDEDGNVFGHVPGWQYKSDRDERIRAMHCEGQHTQRDIAARFGVSPALVNKVLNNPPHHYVYG